jgi:hypothetical protein
MNIPIETDNERGDKHKTVEEFAKLFNYKRSTVFNMIARGDLIAYSQPQCKRKHIIVIDIESIVIHGATKNKK